MSDAPLFPPGTFSGATPWQEETSQPTQSITPSAKPPDPTPFEELAKRLRVIEGRVWSVRLHGLRADQQGVSTLLEGVELDLRRLSVNLGGAP
jgi:hypothetical protein